MLNLTPTACDVKGRRIREMQVGAERRQALLHDVPASERSPSMTLRLRVAFGRSVDTLVTRHGRREHVRTLQQA